MSPPFLDRFPDHSALLLSGPPGVGKLDYLIEALRFYLAARQRVLFVTIDLGPEEVLAHAFPTPQEAKKHVGKTLLFVDCFTPSVSEVQEEAAGVTSVSSFANLEGLGMALSRGAAALSPPVKVLFYTISSLFLHNSSQSLSKFFQIISARVKTEMGLILYASHQGVNDPRQETLLKSLVDGLVEMRFDASMRREIRLHHLRGQRVDATWLPLEGSKMDVLQDVPTASIWGVDRGGES